jgi:hypothetical protein
MTTKAIQTALEEAIERNDECRDDCVRAGRHDEARSVEWVLNRLRKAKEELATLRRDAKTATDCGEVAIHYRHSDEVRAAWRRLREVGKEAP